MQSTKNVRKLVVKNFKGKMCQDSFLKTLLGQRLAEDFEASSWSVLQSGLQDIFAGRINLVSLESMYRTCEDMCRCRMAMPLYSKLQAECELYVKGFEGRLVKLVANGQADVEFLESLQGIWREYTRSIRVVCNAFLFLDRVFVLNRPELVSIWRFSMLQFRTHAMGDPTIEKHIVSSLLGLIRTDRQVEMSEEGVLIAKTLEMLNELQVIELWTHQAIKDSTANFFEKESVDKLKLLSVADYLDYVKDRIDDESRRYANYGLNGQFSAQLLSLVRQKLFVDKLQSDLKAGLATLIMAEDIEHIERYYKLSKETGSEETLKSFWLDYIKSTGTTLVSASGREDYEVVQEIIAMKDRLDRIVTASLSENKVFADGLKESFESFMNSRQNRPVELIARFADYQLRGAGQNISRTLSGEAEERLMQTLDKIIILFRFVQGKDYFELTLKKDLARRLLYARSASLDVERAFVGKLKAECGSAFTSRLEGMFKDMDVTKDTMAAYPKSPQYSKKKSQTGSRLDFSTTIISYGIWPSTPPLPLHIPPYIEREQEAFAEFYDSQHASRIIKYNQGLGHCVIKANFPRGPKELQVSIPQAVVLLMFNDTDELSYPQIRDKSGMDDVNLVKTLQSLACGKINILEKNPKGREVTVEDVFFYNANFASKHQKIRINNVANRESADEAPVSPSEEVAADHQYLIDAALIRVLKKQKSLEIYRLVELVSNQLKTPLGVAECHKRLETLMEREFVARSSENPNVYSYLA